MASKPRPRPKEFDRMIPVRITSAQKLEIGNACAFEQESQAAFIRRALRASINATERKRAGIVRDRECIAKANAAITWIKAHIIDYSTDSDQLAEAIDSIADIIERLSPKGRVE